MEQSESNISAIMDKRFNNYYCRLSIDMDGHKHIGIVNEYYDNYQIISRQNYYEQNIQVVYDRLCANSYDVKFMYNIEDVENDEGKKRQLNYQFCDQILKIDRKYFLLKINPDTKQKYIEFNDKNKNTYLYKLLTDTVEKNLCKIWQLLYQDIQKRYDKIDDTTALVHVEEEWNRIKDITLSYNNKVQKSDINNIYQMLYQLSILNNNEKVFDSTFVRYLIDNKENQTKEFINKATAIYVTIVYADFYDSSMILQHANKVKACLKKILKNLIIYKDYFTKDIEIVERWSAVEDYKKKTFNMIYNYLAAKSSRHTKSVSVFGSNGFLIKSFIGVEAAAKFYDVNQKTIRRWCKEPGKLHNNLSFVLHE